MLDSRRVVYISLMIAMGSAIHLIEGALLPLPIPGIKPGLANIVTLLALYLYGLKEGMLVALMRVLIGSFIGGIFLSPGFFLALSGSIASTLIMAFLLRQTKCFSMVGVSIAGAVAHNTGQLIAAAIILENRAVIFYLPILLITGIPAGFLTGYLLQCLLKRSDSSTILNGFIRR